MEKINEFMSHISIAEWVTITIALIGWTFGIVQLFLKQRWQKKDFLREKRFNAYQKYMNKIDEIGNSMKMKPFSEILGMQKDFITSILNGEPDEFERALVDFNAKLIDKVQQSLAPLTIVNQELNELRLIASDELVEKIEDLRNLTYELSNEMQNCLSRINIKDPNSFTELKTIGMDQRYERFSTLNDEIFRLMRKEINIK